MPILKVLSLHAHIHTDLYIQEEIAKWAFRDIDIKLSYKGLLYLQMGGQNI